MNYSYDNQILLLDIPGRDRLVFRRDELLSITEDFRIMEGQTQCTITLKNNGDNKKYVYHQPMDVILGHLKPILTI